MSKQNLQQTTESLQQIQDTLFFSFLKSDLH